MKLNQIALAVLAAGAATAASAGVTVTPLIGYNYVQEDAAAENQRRLFDTGRQLGGDDVENPKGVALKSDLYTGLALGVELTPSTQLQVEYGVTNPSARASEDSYYADPKNRFSAEQENISANFLIGTEQFSGYNPATKFKPYVLVGGGMQKTSIENDTAYATTGGAATQTGLTGTEAQKIPAGSVIADAGKDTIANLGLGARYLINDALALRGEVRAEHNLDNSWTQGKALAGLEVTLGGRLAPVVPVAPQVEPVDVDKVVIVDVDVVVDSDRDGVPDHLDACPGTPVNTVVDARGCPVQVNLTEELRQELRVFFERDKSVIRPQYRDEVAKVAAAMREFPNATAVIEGHASRDSARSSARHNQRLSEARANAVKSMLTNEFGIAPNRLNAVGFGFDRPIAPNDTEEGRVMNRRVEAVITGTRTTTVDQTKDMVVQP